MNNSMDLDNLDTTAKYTTPNESTKAADYIGNIPSTAKSPEKYCDGKFIQATTGKPSTPDMGEIIMGRVYEQKTLRKYQSLPKRMKHITASISYCHHTNTKLSIGTNFTNCHELSAFIKSEHPLFSKDLPLATAIKIYGKSATPTERYIAMTAILVKSKVIDTAECGVILETQQVEFLRAAFESFLAVLNQCLAFRYRAPIDTLYIDAENQCNFKRILTQLKDVTQSIDSSNFAAGGTRLVKQDDKQTKQIKLDEEIELEKELSKILSGYTTIGKQDGTSIKYSKELNRWTRRALNRSDMTDEQITSTMKILNTSPDALRTGTVEAILPTIKDSLCYEDEISRRNSAIVIRHLEYKIELQMACLHKGGFITEIVNEEVQNDVAATKYITKTRAVQDKAIAAVSIKQSPALAAMRKRMGVK